MLMGGKARKYWKVEKIHEQFGIYQNVTVDITTKAWYSNSMSCNNEYYIKTGIYKDIRGGEREHMKI